MRGALAEQQYRISALILEIARSYPFQYRRDRGSLEVKDE